MNIKNNIAALCGATVLSLGLVSCNNKEVPAPATGANAWGVREPVIISIDGNEIKYGEVNSSENKTFSIDDRLVFIDEKSFQVIRFRTSCARGEERLQYADVFYARSSFELIEFLPSDLLYLPNSRPLANVTCSLEITAINDAGSRHNFGALNLIMNESSQNKFELKYRDLPFPNERNKFIPLEFLKEIKVAPQLDDESLRLQCETIIGKSKNTAVNNLSALDFSDQDLNFVNPQRCRLLKFQKDSVKAVSAFFILGRWYRR